MGGEEEEEEGGGRGVILYFQRRLWILYVKCNAVHTVCYEVSIIEASIIETIDGWAATIPYALRKQTGESQYCTLLYESL